MGSLVQKIIEFANSQLKPVKKDDYLIYHSFSKPNHAEANADVKFAYFNLRRCVHLAMKGGTGGPDNKAEYAFSHQVWDTQNYMAHIIYQCEEARAFYKSYSQAYQAKWQPIDELESSIGKLQDKIEALEGTIKNLEASPENEGQAEQLKIIHKELDSLKQEVDLQSKELDVHNRKIEPLKKDFDDSLRLYLHRKILQSFTTQLISLELGKEQKTQNPTVTYQSIAKEMAECVNFKKSYLHAKASTVLLEDGSKSFSIPGGFLSKKEGHAVVYEIKKEVDGSFAFIIHNRGAGLEDKDLHGSFSYEKGEDRYQRTSVHIKIPAANKDVLNAEFFEALLKAYHSPSMEQPYQVIKDHLLKSKKGQIELSQSERVCKEFLTHVNQEQASKKEPNFETHKKLKGEIKALLSEMTVLEQSLSKLSESNNPQQMQGLKVQKEYLKEKLGVKEKVLQLYEAKPALSKQELINQLKKEAHQALAEDPNYHSIQKWSTCTESCMTLPEKRIASKKIVRQLKLQTLQHVTEDIKQGIEKKKYKGVEKVIVQRQFLFKNYSHAIDYNVEKGAEFIFGQAEAYMKQLKQKLKNNVL